MKALPEGRRWLFCEVDPAQVDADRDANFVLARVLEHGALEDVRWALAFYGLERIHRFFREIGHPEIGDRTREFWRAVLHSENELWASPPDWKHRSSAPWIG